MTEQDNGVLTPRQRRFVAALMTARTVKDAAESVGVVERTGQRWLRLYAVQVALRDAQQEALDQTSRRSVAALTRALDVLKDVMDDASASAGAKVQAAKATLEHCLKLNALTDLAGRVEALERFMNKPADELTDEELTAFIRNAQRTNPDLSCQSVL